MKKQKPLLPTLKEKRRYLVYETISAHPLPKEDITRAIQQTIQWFIGSLGIAKAGIIYLDTDHPTKGIIRVATPSTDHIRAALCYIRNINKTEAIVRSVGLSGTLTKARHKFV